MFSGSPFSSVPYASAPGFIYGAVVEELASVSDQISAAVAFIAQIVEVAQGDDQIFLRLLWELIDTPDGAVWNAISTGDTATWGVISTGAASAWDVIETQT